MNCKHGEFERDCPFCEAEAFRRSEALARGRAAVQARRASGEAIVRLDPIERARRNPTSLRAAITGKCWECQGGDADPHPRQRIRDCEIHSCPLHPVRPYRTGSPQHSKEDSVDESM